MKPRTTPIRRRRKGEDATLTRRLDEASKKLCKLRAGCVCEVCATGEYGVYNAGHVHAHHVVRSTHFALRWHPRNLVCLCWSHHMSASPAPAVAHGDVVQAANFRSWLNTYRSADFTYVLDHAEDDGKLSIPQKKDLLAELVGQILEYERQAA